MSILSNVEDELIPALPRFFENYDEDLEQLNQALENRDAEQIKSTAHRMKASSGSWGFSAIHEAAVALDDAAKAEDWDAMSATLDTLQSRIREAEEAVREELELE